jgi:hypothetical protein
MFSQGREKVQPRQFSFAGFDGHSISHRFPKFGQYARCDWQNRQAPSYLGSLVVFLWTCHEKNSYFYLYHISPFGQTLINKMATTSIEASNLFNVNGLVAVITGGGTGLAVSRFDCKIQIMILMALRYRSHDG